MNDDSAVETMFRLRCCVHLAAPLSPEKIQSPEALRPHLATGLPFYKLSKLHTRLTQSEGLRETLLPKLEISQGVQV